MNPERWGEIKQIYHSALELEPGRREEFLKEACAGDASLLKEVTSLLAQDGNPDGLLESPALEVVAQALGEDEAHKTHDLAGRTLLHYRIEEKIGQGGMGEVYRARDTRLDRTVALKILPEEMQQDETARKRLLREARSAAALDHPFICHIHEIGEIDGMVFIAMEYVEGETLDQRLAKGPLPLTEALEKARELSEALEVAHKRSIVHRDLKPSNIMFTGEGHVKVMDFGLAKRLVFVEDAGSRKQIVSASLTETGTTLGTLAYMSPEQLRGEAVDTRSDIFSFGVVLYEMLTGAHPFKKSQAMETGHAILTEAPAPLAQYLNRPLILLQHALRKMLAKEPERRYQLMHEVKTDLEDLQPEGETSGLPLAEGESLVRPLRQPWRRGLPWVTTVGLLIVLWATWPTTFEPEAARYLNVELSPGVRLVVDEATGPAVDLSPDGSMLAFVGQPEMAGERQQIYVRRLDQLEAMPLAGTEEVHHPVFSPDGQWIAFRAGQQLKKISVNGGAVVTLCQTGQTRGLDWSHDGGSIIFAPGAGDRGLVSVPSAGGIPHPLTRLEDGEVTHRWPQMLPGGKAVLFTAHSRLSQMDEASIVVQRIPGGERRTVWKGGYHARYLPSGHLVFINRASLWAVAFDPETFEMKGMPARVLENVSTSSEYGRAEFAFSEKGTLVYVPGTSGEWTLDWVDREGNREPLLSKPTRFRKFQISPDGQRVAMEIFDGTQFDIWIYDWKGDTTRRLTFNPADDLSPVWSPGGGAIAFASNRDGTFNLYWTRTDGSGEAQRLTASSMRQYPESWHPGGRYLAFEELTPAYDIGILPLEGNDDSGWSAGKVSTFQNAPVSEFSPRFSPDGRWLAYTSNQDEILELYIRPFPGPGGRQQVSDGGISGDPVWSPHRKEIFYALNDQIYRVRYRVEKDNFVADRPEPEEGVRHPSGKFGFRTYDLHPDGRRFAVRTAPAGERNPDRHHVVFIQNFFDYLREQVPSQ